MPAIFPCFCLAEMTPVCPAEGAELSALVGEGKALCRMEGGVLLHSNLCLKRAGIVWLWGAWRLRADPKGLAKGLFP